MKKQKETTNVFEESIYDSCLTESCAGFTQHKSGYCKTCRMKQCNTCKKVMTFSSRLQVQCAYCKSKKRK